MERPSGENEYIRIRRSTLAYLGVFVKYLMTGENIPNRHWAEFGYGAEEMTGDRWLDAVHPDDRAMARRFFAQVRSRGLGRASASYRIRDRGGNWHWMLSTGVIEEWNGDGEAAVYVGLDSDVTELHNLQEQLEKMNAISAERAMEAESLRTAGAVIASSLDKEDAIDRVLEQLRSMVTIDSARIFELVGRELKPAAARDTDDEHEAFFRSEYGEATLLGVIRRRTPEVFAEPDHPDHSWLAIPLVVRGTVAGVYVLGREGRDEFEGAEIRLAMAMADYLALALNNAHVYAEMQRLANRDQLSQLLNRRALIERAETALSDAGARRASISCMILDIDHFKRINDTYGHLVGDVAIRDVARAFEDSLRGQDVVGRYGGEEFCAVLPSVDPETTVAVAERVRAAIGALRVESGSDRLSASIGVATSVDASRIRSLDELLQHADDALYEAKRAGRDRVIVSALPA